MVDGSGLRTAAAVETRGALSSRSPLILSLCVAVLAGCVYFNALYNANQLFDQGRSEIEEGREGSGRATLGTTIEKAQRIIDENPDSRWADDALRLIARAHLLREEWEEARDAAERLMTYYATTREDSTEIAGYLGAAELHVGDPLRADSLLTAALSRQRNPERRAWLLYNRGLARLRLQRHELVDADLSGVVDLRPDWVEPRLERFRQLVRRGRREEAASELRAILALGLNESDQRDVYEVVEEIARESPQIALAALEGVESAELRRETRAGLVKLRADLKVGLRGAAEGRGDYALASSLAPESQAAVSAQVALIRLDLSAVSTLEDLAEVREDVERLARRPFARGQELTHLQDTFIRVAYWLDVGNLGYLLAGEAVRDIFRAPRLARRLFLGYADEQPESFWAPKAILAALDLSSADSLESSASAEALPGPDELRQRLLERYRDSPYVKATLGGGGESRFTYEELELGLRRQLERLQNLANEEVRARRMRNTR